MLTSGSPDLEGEVFEELDGHTGAPGRPAAFSTLAAVSSVSRARRAWIPAGTVAVAMGAIIATGLLGQFVPRGTSHAPTSGRPTAAGAARSGLTGSSAPTTAPTPAPALVAVPDGGYQVTNVVSEAHPPQMFDRGSRAIFGYGPRIGGVAFDGTIEVAVGTASKGVSVAGRGGQTTVEGTTLEDLRQNYLVVASGTILTRSAGEVDGQLSVFMRIDDARDGLRAVALVVHDGRSYVLTSTGFGRLFGAISDAPAEVGLERFVAGFSFAP